MSKLTYEDDYGNTFSVEKNNLGGDAIEFFDDLIKPIMLAAGWHPSIVSNLFDEPMNTEGGQ